MAIHDNDPERRNLVVTSLAFIMFYLGNGVISNNVIKIQLINITFKNPEFLTVTAWVMLFWFALRYWQTHQNSETFMFRDDAMSFIDIKKYITKHTSLKENQSYGFTHPSMDANWILSYEEIETVNIDNKGEMTSWKPRNKSEKSELKVKALYVYICYLKAIFKKQGFSSYIAPYILFYSVIFIALIYKFKCV